MPSRDVLVGFDDDKTINDTTLDFCGIYFDHIKHTVEKDQNWWTLMISFWYPIIIFSILPIVFVARKLYAAKAVRK